MIWRSNLSTECDYFNKTWLDFTGRTFEQEYGFGWAEGVHPDDLDRCIEVYLASFKKQQKFEMDYRLKRYDGQYRWINDRGIPFFNKEGNFTGFIGSCMDITEKIEGQRLKEMAQNDSLCNTYNRQYSYQLLSDLFDQARESGLPFSILMIDVDDFKRINDKYGHAVGDSVLTGVAGAIKKEIRGLDVLGRYGGDEFLIGLVHTGLEKALVAARRICMAITGIDIIPDHPEIRITVSIGVKSLNSEMTLDELIGKADEKLNEAKNEGKNQVKG
jgi:diguanylate cyclase (GGDEF)-like protein/PAS domain S-box-containing protein